MLDWVALEWKLTKAPENMSAGSVEHRAAKVSLVTGSATVLSILFQLVSVPVCLHFWGAEKYGAWLAIFAASVLLRTVDSGYVTYAGNRLNLLYHQDQMKMRRVLAAGSLAVAALSVLQLGVLASAMAFDELGWLLGGAELTQDSGARAALVVLAVTWALSGAYFALVHKLLVPAGMLYQSAWWSMAFQSLNFVAIMLAATFRLSLFETSVLVAGVQAAIYIASADYIRRKLPEFFPWWRAPEWRLAIADIGNSFPFTLGGAMQQLGTNGMILIVSGTLGAASVPAFTTVRTLTNLWTNVTNTLTAPVLPDIVRFHAYRQVDKLLVLSRAHAWLLGSLVNISVLVSLPFLTWVYGVWTRDQIQLDIGLLAGLLGGVLLSNASSFVFTYLAGINHARAVLVIAIVRNLLSLALVSALLPSSGLMAAGIGVLIAEGICFAVMMAFFFPQMVRSLALTPLSSSIAGWPLVGLAISLIVMISIMIFKAISLTLVAVSVSLVLATTWLGWKALEPTVRNRMIALGAKLLRLGGSE